VTGRRERWGVVGAILTAVDAEAAKGLDARLTNIARHANIPHDRLRLYLAELSAQGFISMGPPARLTPQGREFLRHYRDWLVCLEEYGLSPSGRATRRASPSPGTGASA